MAIQAYAAQGLPIYAMTVQNEPQLATDYPSCIMSAEQQRRLVIALKAQFDAHNIDTKILLWDFNTNGALAYMQPILDDPAAKAAVYGSAFHGYSHRDDVMSQVHDAFPDKAIMFTERTYWGIHGMERIANIFRNWAVSYNGWVTMLDSNKAPEQWTGTPGPTMLIRDAGNPDNYWALPEYYLLQHFSRLVQRGAKRIYTSPGDAEKNVTRLAFLNPDNSIALVVMNQTAKSQRFKVLMEGRQLAASLPAGTMASYAWQTPDPVMRSADSSVRPGGEPR
jgi:glucosylceramidase